jgi:predicted nucleotidyltransferase
MGLFSKPKATLAPSIFYGLKMKPSVRQKMLNWVYDLIPQNYIKGITMIGSATGYKWEDDSDIDLQVVLSEESGGYKYWFPVTRKYNGKLLDGTRHPLTMMPTNYSPERELSAEDLDFEAYDVVKDKWIKEPIPQESLVNPFIKNKGDIVYAGLIKTQVDNLLNDLKYAHSKWKVTGDKSWLEETYRVFKDLASIFFEIDRNRKNSYAAGWGIPRYSSENIIFKYIEKKEYLHILQDIYRYLRDTEGEFVGKEI